MNSKMIKAQAEQFCKNWQGMEKIYEDYCRSVDVPYTTLYILNLITQMENCTQKDICERGLIPKQTVNAVITGFYKQGLVELRELQEDRRIKSIHLTSKGQEYADSILPQIRQAEYDTMKSLSEEQRKVLLDIMEQYCDTFRKNMLKQQ